MECTVGRVVGVGIQLLVRHVVGGSRSAARLEHPASLPLVRVDVLRRRALRSEAIRRWGAVGALRYFQDDAHGEGSKARFRTMLLSMPSLSLLCEIMAARVADARRKVRPQDRLDVDHATVAPAYCDYFVTRDGNLRDLLDARCTVPSRRGCRILGSLDELLEVLENIGASG